MDALDRLQTKLIEALRERGVQGPTHQCTIAEIYQKLIPYRAVRSELRFSELPEYEHTLLRLLAGERAYLSVDLPQVKEEFSAELQATNPILGVYRDYAAVGVALQLTEPEATNGTLTADRAERPPIEEPPLDASPVPDSAPQAVQPQAGPPPPAPASPSIESVACPHCGESLPRGQEARFCPYCGVGIRAIPCSECGSEVEPHWRYCAQCGTSSPFPAR